MPTTLNYNETLALYVSSLDNLPDVKVDRFVALAARRFNKSETCVRNDIEQKLQEAIDDLASPLRLLN
jgi:hypothetical protein